MLDVNFFGFQRDKTRVPEEGLDKMWKEFDATKDEEDENAVVRPLMFMSATDGLTPSPELGDHGLFSAVLLEALSGKADKEGDDPDGIVTVDELFTYFGKEYTRRAQASVSADHELRPILAGKSTHYALSLNPAAADIVAGRLDKFQNLARQLQLPEDVVKEGKDYLSKMPRMENQRKLRKKYQELVDGKVKVEAFLADRQNLLKAMTVSREDAEKFADKLIRVAKYAQAEYVKPVRMDEMALAAVKGLFRVVDEKMTKEWKDRLEGFKTSDEKEVRQLLIDARQYLGNRDAIKDHRGLDVALKLMLHSLDKHSTWISPEEVDEFRRGTAKVFIGVGIQIRKDLARDVIRVSTPVRGSPAYKAGLKQGDLITGVINTVDEDGKPLSKPEVTDTKGMAIGDVVKKIVGKQGTKVKLVIEREEANGPKTMEFELTRNKVESETVFGVRRNDDDTWDYYLDPANKIVYVRLAQFGANTYRDLKATLEKYQGDKYGINGLVLDLRFDPGGYLDSAVEICDLLVDDGVLVTVKQREGKRGSLPYYGHHEGSMVDFPLVVLVNGGSASASEIVSACIQDQERGVVMGERSYGKGSVQTIRQMDLGDGVGEIKLTIASFWRPSNKNLNKFQNSKDEDDWGVSPRPEHTVKLSVMERNELEQHLIQNEAIPRRDAPKMATQPTFVDRQLDAAVDYLRKQVAAKTSLKKAG